MRRTLLAWTVETDPSLTRAVYRAVGVGAAARCGCAACRNFDAVRPGHYPEGLRRLLSSVTIDARKEQAVRLVASVEQGRHLYAGHYLFCGEVLAGRPYRGFPFLREEVDVFERVDANTHVAIRPWRVSEGIWAPHPCVRLEFLVVLPWVVDPGGGPGAPLESIRRNSGH